MLVTAWNRAHIQSATCKPANKSSTEGTSAEITCSIGQSLLTVYATWLSDDTSKGKPKKVYQTSCRCLHDFPEKFYCINSQALRNVLLRMSHEMHVLRFNNQPISFICILHQRATCITCICQVSTSKQATSLSSLSNLTTFCICIIEFQDCFDPYTRLEERYLLLLFPLHDNSVWGF